MGSKAVKSCQDSLEQNNLGEFVYHGRERMLTEGEIECRGENVFASYLGGTSMSWATAAIKEALVLRGPSREMIL